MCETGSVDVVVLYFSCCALLAVFSLHRVWLLVDFARARRQRPTTTTLDDVPGVVVQLPLYNEAEVAERLLDASAQLQWPHDKLVVQLLDDSDDHTTDRLAPRVAHWRAQGVQVEHVRREVREGYKAGALAHGLDLTTAPFVAVFDADFVPPADFLQKVMPAFVDDDVGMVQARWGHLNRQQSWLTRAQAAFLDAHFSIEHLARAGRGRFFNFNGTAGVWRRTAIDNAGGWDAATLTEDLDLSFRAQLKGARFVYLDDVEVPAELPADVDAFKSQQHRWAKGSMQTARRLLPSLWAAKLPWVTKLDATLKLLQNTAFLLLALVMVTLPMVALQHAHGASWVTQILEWGTLSVATLPVALHFAAAQRARHRRWRDVVLSVPLGIGLGGALSLHNARAVLEGMVGKGHDVFVRTPKAGGGQAATALTSYRARMHPLAWLEFALGATHLVTAWMLLSAGKWLTVPFLLLFGVSLLAMSTPSFVRTFTGSWARWRASTSSPTTKTA